MDSYDYSWTKAWAVVKKVFAYTNHTVLQEALEKCPCDYIKTLIPRVYMIIEEINAAGTTILLVEQNANLALSIANRAYVVETGKIVLAGTPDELTSSEKVKMAYLGGH